MLLGCTLGGSLHAGNARQFLEPAPLGEGRPTPPVMGESALTGTLRSRARSGSACFSRGSLAFKPSPRVDGPLGLSVRAGVGSIPGLFHMPLDYPGRGGSTAGALALVVPPQGPLSPCYRRLGGKPNFRPSMATGPIPSPSCVEQSPRCRLPKPCGHGTRTC